MTSKLAILIMLLGGVFLSTACQNESAKPTDPLAKAYQRIDKGEYSEAIDELSLLSQQDSRPEVSVTLASAYAARAGIKVSQYWGFVIGFKAPLLSAEDLPLNSTAQSLQKIAKQTTGKATQQDLEAVGQIVKAIALWDLYKDRVSAIPVVDSTAEQDLLSAVRILAAVQTPGGRLYRAILNLILFKTYVMATPEPFDDFKATIDKTISGNTAALCEFDFLKFTSWLQPLSTQLNETLLDLTIAFPEQNQNLSEARVQVLDVEGNLLKARKQLRQRRGCQ